MDIFKELKYDEKGLIPAIVQDFESKKVLMLAYMNEESLKKTVDTKTTWFYSRSRKQLWNKGETSGNIQEVISINYDCDKDALLVLVNQKGQGACHTGKYSCFYNNLFGREDIENNNINNFIEKLYSIVEDRKNNPVKDSYTSYLFEKGLDKILKKIGEESSEVIIGAKNLNNEEIIYEISDLVYHTVVLMVEMGITLEDIKYELYKRHS
ncbi:bifunctional phosphoribosyl-AMP cyclohydrolase/phosphoribosyl-ATP diphosphatase HisIE [Brassicibacter mesophilus]|uniref:bifunctional phosphoribosyl-AMP cyclohydrolase/phosphoribosyl-ATP diphosphatase HisIE n=1 Tax=Brassicibacter mesophilus TaxID=745119 RepID=UPI003D1AD21F